MTDASLPAAEAVQSEARGTVRSGVEGSTLGPKGIGWAVFEWARNPYYNIIVIYVFATYFTQVLVGDGVRGQTLVSYTITIAGVIMAVGAPTLGALADKGGGKKLLIGFSLAVLGLCAAGLGFMAPDLPLAVPLSIALLVTGYCMYTVSEVLHNAMLPGAGRPSALPHISGLGLFAGNIAGVLLLLFFANAGGWLDWSQVAPGGLGQLSGPIVAVWLAVFILPFFLLMPEHRGHLGSWRKAWTATFGRGAPPLRPWRFVAEKFREYPNVMRYLLARMIYADGMAVLLVLGGVYVAGVLGYSVAEVAVFGAVGSLFGAVGGFVGGRLDQVLGPKRALMLEIVLLMAVLVIQISFTPTGILFGLLDGSVLVWGDPDALFATWSKFGYLLMVIPAGILIVSVITSSRYMLVHISPPDRIGEFFGFYAMAGSITVWMAPLLVGIVTEATQSQRLGMVSVSLLFFAGLAILAGVRAGKVPEHALPDPRY